MSGYLPALTETSLRNIIRAIRDLSQGRSNACGQVTLRANQATTTVRYTYRSIFVKHLYVRNSDINNREGIVNSIGEKDASPN